MSNVLKLLASVTLIHQRTAPYIVYSLKNATALSIVPQSDTFEALYFKSTKKWSLS